MSDQPKDRTRLGILMALIGVFAISLNDVIIKWLSGDYPLHQMVLVRSGIGIWFSLLMLQFEGGLRTLWPKQPRLQALRAFLIVIANLSYFTALTVLPLADATALYFVAPLFTTILGVLILGERVGVHRITAILVGFAGVLVMIQPWSGAPSGAPLWALLLPMVAAAGYSGMSVLTRKLGATSSASAMAIYFQITFIMVSSGFYVLAGDGRFAEGQTNEGLVFLFRPWIWPEIGDLWLFAALGFLSAVIGYTMSQAYRLGKAATIASFEYAMLPMAILWGWVIFGTLPGAAVVAGIVLIVGAGLYVFERERRLSRKLAAAPSARRRAG